ncbi:hypothetical protein NN561_013318 [Cricetulus griseus]
MGVGRTAKTSLGIQKFTNIFTRGETGDSNPFLLLDRNSQLPRTLQSGSGEPSNLVLGCPSWRPRMAHALQYQYKESMKNERD